MCLFYKFTGFKKQYLTCEDLICTLNPLPKMEIIKLMIPDWNSAERVTQRGYKFIKVTRDPNLNYYLFHWSQELDEYFWPVLSESE